MYTLQGIYCTDGIARDNSQLAISALDDMIWMASDGGRPTNMSHDNHKFIGWSVVNGLYISHELSYVVGNTYIPVDEKEMRILRKYRKAFVYKSMKENLEKYEEDFKAELSKHSINNTITQGNFSFINIALYGYQDIIYEIFPHLKEYVDNDGLISLKTILLDFNYCGQGIFKSKHNPLAIMLHPFFRRNFSIYNNYNFGFLDKLFEVYNNGNHSVKIRLETNFIGYAPSNQECREYEYWYGPQYNDDIRKIPEGLTRFETDEVDKLYTNIKSTEFMWQKKDDGKLFQFEMEEITDTEAPTLEKNTYACRYLHALYNFESNEFNHFDGAIRCYGIDKIIERIETPMNKMGHQAGYTKIFRIDGQIPINVWKALITQYLCSNNSVYDYFGIDRPYPRKAKALSKRKTLQDYVPYLIDKGDGIRLFVSYHDKKQFNTTRCFCNYDSIELSDGIYDAIDFSTLEVAKALWKVGAEIKMPTNVKVILVKDEYHNIPQIFHSNANCQDELNETMRAIRLLINQHISNGDNEIYSFSVGWNIENRSVSISFMGHVSDLQYWLKSFDGIPTKRENLKKWIELQNEFIHKYGKESPSPLCASHIKDDGTLYFQHRHVLKDASINDLELDINGRIIGTIETEDEVLKELFNKSQIHMSPLFVVNDATDEKTEASYFDSLASGIFNETRYIIDQAQLLGFVWTTSPKRLTIAK